LGKNVKFLVLIMTICVLSFVSIGLYFYMRNAHDKFDDDIVIEVSGKTVENFSIDNLTLTPGVRKEYSVSLYCRAEGDFTVTVDCLEKEDGGLKDFVYVEVSVNGEVVGTEKLSDILKDDCKITFSQELFAKKPAKVIIAYTMSDEIENEAMGTYADFQVEITVDKE